MSIADHEQKFADWPRIANRPIPVPPEHPEHPETDEQIAADMETLHRCAAFILSRVVTGAKVTPSAGLIEYQIDQCLPPWPTIDPPVWGQT